MYFSHYREVPKEIWRWKNFIPAEIASNRDGSLLLNFQAMDTLQKARDMAGKAFVIHCGYRDELHNANVGGAPRSLHLEGKAFDIGLVGFTKPELIGILKEAGFTGLGVHYATFVHADIGRKRQW